MTDTLLLNNNLTYNTSMENQLNKTLSFNKYNPKKISEFINQFEEQRFDTISQPASANDTHITITGVNNGLQRDIDFKNGYSQFQMNNMHYDVVSRNQFIHNNMVPNTSKRDFDTSDGRNSNDHRKLETFTGIHKYYTEKKEKVPLFEPMTDLTWVNGMPSITDKMKNRYLPSTKNNNGDLPFQNNLRVKPGLDNLSQKGKYAVYKINPRNIDALRSEINQKETYNNIPIESGKRGNISGSINPTLTKYKMPDFREQSFDTLIPGKYLNEMPKVTGEYTNVDSQRGENSHTHFNPAVNRTQGDGPDKNKILYQQAKKENYYNDPTHAVVSIAKPVMTNAKSFTNYETHRATTNYDKGGIISYNNAGNYVLSNDFILDTTNRNTTSAQPVLNATSEVKMGSASLSDRAKTTIRETTDNELLSKLKVLKPDAYTSYVAPTDKAKITIRQTVIDDANNFNTSLNPMDHRSYTEQLDDARTTIRQTTSHNDITGVQSILDKANQVYFSDNAKPTIRQTTNHNIVANPVGVNDNSFRANLTDNAKTTIRQTANYNIVANPVGTNDNSFRANPTDNAKTTIRQTANYNIVANPVGVNDNSFRSNLTDNAKPTIRQTINHNIVANIVGVNDNSFRANLTDNAKQTIRQTTNHNIVANPVGVNDNSFRANPTDDAKTTIRETTEINNYIGHINSESLNSGYVKDYTDIAKMTIRQTTENNKHEGNITTMYNDGTYVELQDKAKPTIKQTTLLQDYVGGLNYVINNNKQSREASENMTIDNRREVLTYSRAPNAKSDTIGPNINRDTVRLNEPILFSYVPGPRSGSDYSVTPLQCRITDANENQKPIVDYSNYYINNNFINTLKNNPLVNDIYHQKNI